MKNEKSKEIFQQGKSLMPGGVSSPVRKFSEVDTPPIIIDSGSGGYFTDVDGNRYLDLVGGLGPAILGHGNPNVSRAVSKQMQIGSVYAAGTELEYKLASMIKKHTPAIEKLRFVCSGTEAVMSAVRLAKAHTKRPSLIKFNGCYHGHADNLQGHITKSGKSSARDVKGIHHSIVAGTHVCEYNNLEQVDEVFQNHAEEIACVILEPVATNMGLVKPKKQFLKGLRELCDKYNALLIFDEVVVGYRLQMGSVSNWCEVRPDLITYGKIIGGGMPVGMYGGDDEIMMHLDEVGGVFQGGTFAGNPLTMAAGLATMEELEKPLFYQNLSNRTENFANRLSDNFLSLGLPFSVDQAGSLFSLILIDGVDKLRGKDDVIRQNTNLFAKTHKILASRGYMLPPSIEEPGFVNSEHTQAELYSLADAIAESLNEVINTEANNNSATSHVAA